MTSNRITDAQAPMQYEPKFDLFFKGARQTDEDWDRLDMLGGRDRARELAELWNCPVECQDGNHPDVVYWIAWPDGTVESPRY